MTKKKNNANENDGESKGSMKGYVISTVVLALSVVIALYVAIQTLAFGYTTFFGFSIFRVVTGSMEPTIPVNAVLVCKSTDIEQIKVSDIICFRSRESSHYGSIVTHRVVSIQEDGNGELHLESRGDANYSSDPYYVTKDNLIGAVVWYTGQEGVLTGVLKFLTGPVGFIALIVFPILVIAGLILQGVGRNIRNEIDATLEKLAKTKRDPEPEEELPKEDPMPGYKALTQRDYDELYEKLKNEFRKELNDRAEGSEAKTEYSEKDQA